jgi:hypothetical protein
MVGGTYLSTGPNPFFGMTRIAGAQSSEELLREYAAKDSDTDGLPDWQESLYGTDPMNPESFQAGTKDGEAVAQGLIEPKVIVRAENEPTDPDSIPGTEAAPNSLTDRFAQTLLKQYLLNRTDTPPTQEEIVSFVKEGVADLSASYVQKPAYVAGDMTVSNGSGTEALRTYVSSLEHVFLSTGANATKNELYYFEDGIRGDATAKKYLINLAGAYLALSNAVATLPVPREALSSHTALANAFSKLSKVTEDMAALDSDPLRALLGIAQHDEAAKDLFNALTNLGAVMDARQIRPLEGENGYVIYTVTRKGTN